MQRLVQRAVLDAGFAIRMKDRGGESVLRLGVHLTLLDARSVERATKNPFNLR
jgi:hypothetical protein